MMSSGNDNLDSSKYSDIITCQIEQIDEYIGTDHMLIGEAHYGTLCEGVDVSGYPQPRAYNLEGTLYVAVPIGMLVECCHSTPEIFSKVIDVLANEVAQATPHREFELSHKTEIMYKHKITAVINFLAEVGALPVTEQSALEWLSSINKYMKNFDIDCVTGEMRSEYHRINGIIQPRSRDIKSLQHLFSTVSIWVQYFDLNLPDSMTRLHHVAAVLEDLNKSVKTFSNTSLVI